jgi:anti-sigma factor RsiW
MTQNFQCGDQAALVGYLYDDCEPLERDAIAAHVISCAACAEELAMLSATRRQLASWTPPEARLGFRITAADADSNVVAMRPAGDGGTRGAWWRQPLPAWAQLAAAAAIFAIGLSVGSTRASGAGTAQKSSDAAALRVELAKLERRLVGIESGTQRTPGQVALVSQPGERGLLSVVRAEMRQEIAQSEKRLQDDLALRQFGLVVEQEERRRLSNEELETNINEHVNNLFQLASFAR